jgi:glycosyltransferase involved in cell wall biosynthesis
MATYNGERYVVEQLESILAEIGESDELVIVDDASRDSTVDIIRGVGDPRVRLVVHDVNRGYVKAFETAIRLARGKMIYLSDQDDVWIPGRIEVMSRVLLDEADVVVGNCEHFGGPLTPFLKLRVRPEDSSRAIRNVWGILVGYRLHWGSAMGFRSSFRDLILPFPAFLTESHDQWIAIVGNLSHSIRYLDEDVVRHRLHGQNVTPRRVRRVGKILVARWEFLQEVMIAQRRIVRRRAWTGAE